MTLVQAVDELLQTIADKRGVAREPDVKFADELMAEVQQATETIRGS